MLNLLFGLLPLISAKWKIGRTSSGRGFMVILKNEWFDSMLKAFCMTADGTLNKLLPGRLSTLFVVSRVIQG